MTELLDKRLDRFAGAVSKTSLRRGIEREALRVDRNGTLSQRPHPRHLGSKLYNPYITTDFSEAQPELITPVYTSVAECLEKLEDIHRYLYSGLEDEMLWLASMPCVLDGDENIPLADYGPSNLGRLKHTYRNGLGYRYGRLMQTICAVHYNFSLADELWDALRDADDGAIDATRFRSARYFDLMRNFRRWAWLPMYLFGASPAICKSFVKGREHRLTELDYGSLYLPYATSLRNGDLGYQSNTQGELLTVCYNDLESYVESLAQGITTPHERYARLGVGDHTEYRQVSINILQSEAEFYTTVRAKAVPPPGVNFLKVLRGTGVEYLEVRLLDVNPFHPLGIGVEEIRFLDTMLVFCLLAESPFHDDRLCEIVGKNLSEAVVRGRDPELRLVDGESERPLREWGLELVEAMARVADILDRAFETDEHAASLEVQRKKLLDPSLTPSARVLEHLDRKGVPYFRFAMDKSLEHRDYFLSRPLDPGARQHFQEVAEESVGRQRELERQRQPSFEDYVAAFLAEYEDVAGNGADAEAVS